MGRWGFAALLSNCFRIYRGCGAFSSSQARPRACYKTLCTRVFGWRVDAGEPVLEWLRTPCWQWKARQAWRQGEHLPVGTAPPPGWDLNLLAVVVTSDGGKLPSFLQSLPFSQEVGPCMLGRLSTGLGQERTVCAPDPWAATRSPETPPLANLAFSEAEWKGKCWRNICIFYLLKLRMFICSEVILWSIFNTSSRATNISGKLFYLFILELF